MDRLKLLDAGLRAFDTRLPDVVPPLCVRTRYRASACRRCLDVCPADAIAATPWLEVDPQRCTSCGACGAACKTGALAFDARSAALRDRMHEAAAAGASVLRLVCRRAEAAEAADRDDAIATLAVRCLGGLGAGDLVAAAAFGLSAIVLVDGDCRGCTDDAAGAAVDRNAEAARETVAGFSAAIEISRDTSASRGEPEPAPKTHRVSDSATVSRRGLFTFAARGLRRTAADGAAPAKRSAAVLHRQAPPARMRARLLDDLATLAARSGAAPASLPAALPLAHVIVAASCDGCGLCVRYCPHAALTSSREGRVDADDALCTGCELCVETCPREALALERASFRPQGPTSQNGSGSA